MYVLISQTIKNLTNISKRTNDETTFHAYILYPMQRLQQILHCRNPTHYRKNNLQTLNQNKWRSKCPFLPQVRAQTHIQFFQAILIEPIHCKKSQRLLESVVISRTNHIWQCPGFYQILPYLANIILNKNRIENRYMCVYIFICIYVRSIFFLEHVWLNRTDTKCLSYSIFDPSKSSYTSPY